MLSQDTELCLLMQKYLTICSVLHEARSQRYIAEDYRKAEKLGVAVGILRHSMSRVKQVRTPSKILVRSLRKIDLKDRLLYFEWIGKSGLAYNTLRTTLIN